MARMSIDDKFLRDARVVLLGRRFGWGRRETMGALLDLFAIAYDREDDIITAAEIDVTAGEAGFADALIDVDLGEQVDDGVRIKGAAERIEYLAAKREAGRRGGRKSGETRRNRREAKRSTASPDREAHGNPPDPVPDLPPDPVPEDQTLPPARDPAVPGPEPTQVVQEQHRSAGGAGAAAPPPPAPALPGPLVTNPAEVRAELERHREAVPSSAIPRAVTRAELVESTAGPYDPGDPRAIGRLAEQVWRQVSDAAISLAAELKLPAPLPFPPITPSTNRKGFVELKQRIREEGELAPAACDRALENTVKLARARRSVEWLSEKLFGENAWPNARNGIDPSARSPVPGRRGDPPPTPARRPDPEPPPVLSTLTPEERLALAAQALSELYGSPSGPAALPTAELVKRFGDGPRAPPSSAGPHDETPDENHRRRKAAK